MPQSYMYMYCFYVTRLLEVDEFGLLYMQMLFIGQ